jgi:hypothetical protein
VTIGSLHTLAFLAILRLYVNALENEWIQVQLKRQTSLNLMILRTDQMFQQFLNNSMLIWWLFCRPVMNLPQIRSKSSMKLWM